jgi:hypothetical protein
MEKVGKSINNFINDCDIIIGSDLLYFAESIEPLFGMVQKMFAQSKLMKKNVVFYMCMMLRGKEIHESLDAYIASNQDNLKFEILDQEYIIEQAKEVEAQMCFLYKITSQI